MPAILMKIHPASETVTVLRIDLFDSDEAALAWFAKQRKKYAN